MSKPEVEMLGRAFEQEALRLTVAVSQHPDLN
jgi:hypothetical protein